MQQLETYFGCRVRLGKSITANAFKSHVEGIKAALNASGADKDAVELYVCEVHVNSVESHFDHSPLHEKLGVLNIHLKIGQKNRDNEWMYFSSMHEKHKVNPDFQHKAEKFDLQYSIVGTYFESRKQFHEIIYIIVDKDIRPRDRKVKVKFLATPTSKFANKLRNIRNASTQLDLELDPRIQLRFDF